MRKKILPFIVVAIVALLPGNSLGDTYHIYDTWGGTWADAEKTVANTDDDNLCWAAASSNVLEYTGWGKVEDMTNTDQIFSHFQAHFTDEAGNSYYGFDWWWDGTNDVQGEAGWAQEDVDGGGGFYPTLDIDDYRRWTTDDSAALSTLDAWMHGGYGCTLSISGSMAHAITAWGFDYDATDPDRYTGIYVTDSDDYIDSLRHYALDYHDSAWYLLDYYGMDNNYISEVCGLAMVPIPGAVLLGMLGLSIAGAKLRKMKA
ncbi:MAG: hypothetical protein ABFE13_09295 [Phycisphaerales bacterium]